VAELSNAEAGLFGKYYGDTDLVNNDLFWIDVMMTLMREEKTILLPLVYNPESVRRVHSMLKCKAGDCGRCCNYKRIIVTEADTALMVESGKVTPERLADVLHHDDTSVFISGDGGCPFLKDAACTIYECRPNICWQFPVMGGKERIYNGKPIQQMIFRLMCQPGVDVARALFREAVANGNSILLPDLTIVQKIKMMEVPGETNRDNRV